MSASTIAAAGGVLALPIPEPTKLPLGADCVHQRGMGGGGNATGAEERHRQPTALGNIVNDVERNLVVLPGGAGELL